MVVVVEDNASKAINLKSRVSGEGLNDVKAPGFN